MKINKEQIKEILYSFANLSIKKNDPEYNIIHELLTRHPEADQKIGVGVDHFYVQRSKWKRNQYNFMISRVDGTTVDFSYIACLNPTHKKYTEKHDWNPLFRHVVKDQIDSFRECAFAVVGSRDKFVCSQTKLKYKKIYSHVDHVYPLTFESILLEFIKKYNVDLDSLKVSKDLGTTEIQRILNKDVTKAFYEFHKERSVLRIVCSSANLQAKRTKDYNNEDPTKLRKILLKEYPQYHVK
jgi:hypothetical protein